LDVEGDLEDDWEIDDWAGGRSEEEYAAFFGMTPEELQEYRMANQVFDEEEAKLQERLVWETRVHGSADPRTLRRLARAQGKNASKLFEEPDPREVIERFSNQGGGAQSDEFKDVEINDTWIVEISAFGSSASEMLDTLESDFEETPEVRRRWWKGDQLCSAGVVMARWLAMHPAPQPVAGKTVVELGCGLGLPSIIAAILGAKHVLLTDYYEPGLREAMKSVVHTRVSDVATGLRSNWTDLPDRLFNANETEGLQKFQKPDLILGADILFEEAEASQVAEVLSKLLQTPDQIAQIIDPYKRPYKRHFVKECQRFGLVAKKVEVCTWEPESDQMENDENWFCDLFSVQRAP